AGASPAAAPLQVVGVIAAVAIGDGEVGLRLGSLLRGVLRLADRGAEDPHVVAAYNLPGIIGSEAAAQHCADELHPLCVILHTPGGYLLVRANGDVFHPDDLYHLFETIHVFVEAWKKVPNTDRATGLCNSSSLPPGHRNSSWVVPADLTTPECCGTHGPGPR